MDGAEEESLGSPLLSGSSHAVHQRAAGAVEQFLAAKAVAMPLLS